MAKIIDTTLFSNDFRVLQLRLEELWDVVDEFVVCESNYSFSGKQKPLYLSEAKQFISPYSSKLRIVRYNLARPNKIPWINEMSQRAFINTYLRKRGISFSDTITHSDCDEIPKSEVLKCRRDYGENLLLELRNYTFLLNLRSGFYTRARVVLAKHFRGIEFLRRDIFLHELKITGFRRPFIRVPVYWSTSKRFHGIPRYIRYPKLKLVRDAGWHFNNLMTPEEIQAKIGWSSHTELANSTTLDLRHISDSIANGTDVYRPGIKFHREELRYLPRTVSDDLDRWKNFIAQ